MNALHFALRDGWRLLRARPLGNLAAVLVLACGLSAVITVASLSHLVLGARPSSMPADRLLSVYGTGFGPRSEEHTSELQSLMRISYAVFCLKKKKTKVLICYTE